MNVQVSTKVWNALVRINNLYGKGDLERISLFRVLNHQRTYLAGTVWQVCPYAGRYFRRYRVENNTVSFLHHQARI